MTCAATDIQGDHVHVTHVCVCEREGEKERERFVAERLPKVTEMSCTNLIRW